MQPSEIENLKEQIMKGYSAATVAQDPSIMMGFNSAIKLIVYLELKLEEKENDNE